MHTLRIAALTCAIALPASSIAAQDRPPDVRELASALAEERARVAELKAELERRSKALADLSERVTSILGGPPPPEPQPVPAATPARVTDEPVALAPTPSRFDFYGDARVRYDGIRQDSPGCVECPDRNRERLRLRFGAEGHLSPDFAAGFGFSAGDIDDPNTVYVTLANNFGRKAATWDRGYVEYHPVKAPWLDVTAGKFAYTWMRSPMTFDVDFYPEGLSERLSFNLRHAGRLKNVGVQGFQLLVNEQPADRHMTIVGTQLTAKIQPVPRLTTTMAATALDIRRPDLILHALLDGSDVGVRNTNTTVVADGVASYASGFRYANVIVENAVRTPWDAWPLVASVEYQRNIRAASNRDTGLSFRLDAGRAERSGDWQLSSHIFRVEQDAILAALGESDWRAPSNVLQQRYAASRLVHANVQLALTWYRGRTLDRSVPGALLAPGLPLELRDPWTNRIYLDVTYKY